MNIELKPCPFCGGEARIGGYEYVNSGGHYHPATNPIYVICTKCGAKTRSVSIRTLNITSRIGLKEIGYTHIHEVFPDEVKAERDRCALEAAERWNRRGS